MTPAAVCDCGHPVPAAVPRALSHHQRRCLVYLRAELERTRGALRSTTDRLRRQFLDAHIRYLVDLITQREAGT